MVDAYLQTTPLRLDELEAAVRDGDAALAGRLAHALAGSSGALAATRLASYCKDLDVAARSELCPSLGDVHRLRVEHEQAASALTARLAVGALAGRVSRP